VQVIEKDTGRDRYLSAIQSKEYGLIDEILTNPSKTKVS
jgi:ATP-dependent protease ClpP protease subunit